MPGGEVSIGGVSVQGSISVGRSLSRGQSLVQGVSVHGGGGSLSRGISVQGGVCLGGLCHGDTPRMVTSRRYASYWNAFLFEVDMTFTLNDIVLQMTLTFEQASVEYKYVIKLCKS